MLANVEKWYRVSLRLWGDGLPVDEIEEKLGLPPDSTGKKGEHVLGNPQYYKRNTNSWVICADTDSDMPFELQITHLLDEIEPSLDAVREILSLPDVTGELFLGFGSGNGQGGATFSPQLLARIASWGLILNLDLYPPDVDEEGE